MILGRTRIFRHNTVLLWLIIKVVGLIADTSALQQTDNEAREQNSQTFFLSNMQPQYHNHNGGKWATLEEKYELGLIVVTRLYVVKAATITDVTLNGSTQSGLLNVMCNNSLIVPAYFYMAMMSYNKSTDTYKSLGIWTNRSNTASEITIEYITIDELERRTGIDFFCNLPDEMEDEVESSS